MNTRPRRFFAGNSGRRSPTAVQFCAPRKPKHAAGELDGPLWVVKAQIHAGGRGKGHFKEADAGEKGGVRLAKSVEEAEAEEAKKMLGRTLVTKQTGPPASRSTASISRTVQGIEREMYLALLVDRQLQPGLASCRLDRRRHGYRGSGRSDAGERSCRSRVDPATGYQPYHGRRIAFIAGVWKARR